MRIVISEIPDEGLDITGETSLALEVTGDRVLALHDLHVLKSGTDVFITGTVSARGSLFCSRCLKDFPWEMQSTIDAVYIPVETAEPEPDHELMTGDLNTSFYRGDELDLDEFVSEQVLLSVPMKPLCRESCRGMCSQCGADLNTKQCNCYSVRRDSRFEVLEKLLHKGKE